jgi:hypothetical protein
MIMHMPPAYKLSTSVQNINIRKPLQKLNKQLCKNSGIISSITVNEATVIKRPQKEQM